MIKRVTWFVSGALAGAASAEYAKRKVKATAAQLTPVNVARGAVSKVRAKGADVVDAVREGRRAMRDKEAELHAKLHGVAAPLSDELAAGLAPDDQILVDGKPVQPGQVIVLRQVRDAHHHGPRRTARRTRRGA